MLMKKMFNIGKIILLTIAIMAGLTNICFADVVATPVDLIINPLIIIIYIISALIPLLRITLIILCIFLFIFFIYFLILKAVQFEEESIDKVVQLCENMAYYSLFILCLIMMPLTVLDGVFISYDFLAIIVIILYVFSIGVRWIKHNKRLSYFLIFIAILLIFLMSTNPVELIRKVFDFNVV